MLALRHTPNLLFLLKVVTADRANLLDYTAVCFLCLETRELTWCQWIETLIDLTFLIEWLESVIAPLDRVFVLFMLCESDQQWVIPCDVSEDPEEVLKSGVFKFMVGGCASDQNVNVCEEPANAQTQD